MAARPSLRHGAEPMESVGSAHPSRPAASDQERQICYAFAHRIRPLGAAAQHQQERARGRRKWPGSIAGMQAAGSEAERRQAGLTDVKVRVAVAELRSMR